MSDTVTLEVIHILNIILICNFCAFLTKTVSRFSDLVMVYSIIIENFNLKIQKISLNFHKVDVNHK